MKRKSLHVGLRGLVLGIVATLASSLVAETLTFQTGVKSGDTYLMTESGNWNKGRAPAEGDDLYFGCWISGKLGANRITYVKSITFNEWFYCDGISYSGFFVKSGGSGITFNKNNYPQYGTLNMWANFYLDGEVSFSNVNRSLWVDGEIRGRDADHPGRLLKKGEGTLAVKTAGDYWTGATIREGTFKLLNTNGKTGLDITFDGAQATAYFTLNGNLTLTDGALRSSADLPKAEHGVTDAGKGYALTLAGALKDASAVFCGGLHGAASFVFNPTDGAKNFAFSRATSTSTGSITVKNGTVALTNGASFASLTGLNVTGSGAKLVIDCSANLNLSAATLTIAEGGAFALGGGLVRVKAVTVNGKSVPSGLYGTSSVNNATVVDWIGGSGFVAVGLSDDEVAATWNGTGSVAASENWSGTMPALHDGTACVTVAGGSRMALDTTDAWFKGLTLGIEPFEIAVAEGRELWLGAKGIANPSQTNLTLSGDVVMTSAQTWNMGYGLLDVSGRIKSFGETLTLNTYGTSLRTTGETTIDANLLLPCVAILQTADNANLTVNGSVTGTNQSQYIVARLGKGSRLACKGFSGANCSTIMGTGTLVLKGPMNIGDRLYMRDSQGAPTIEFWATGNRVNGNIGEQTAGTVKTLVDGAFSAENGVCFSPKKSFTIDLCGHDQSVRQLGMHATGTELGGIVTSETAAVLHLKPNSYWAWHNFNQCFDRSSPDAYGYETADKGRWTGGVTLRYEASNGLTRSMMRESSSTGSVEVVAGTLAFLRRARTTGETFDLKGGSANPYERLEDVDGAWPNATKAIVRGGILKLEHGKAFGKATAFELWKAGKLQLEEGVRQRCSSLMLDGVAAEPGTYGSSESAAKNKDDEHFTGPGLVRVGKIGTCLILR